MKKNAKIFCLGLLMAVALMVTATGMVADAAYELCTHYWTVEEV